VSVIWLLLFDATIVDLTQPEVHEPGRTILSFGSFRRVVSACMAVWLHFGMSTPGNQPRNCSPGQPRCAISD